ncbi:MAG TPA: peptide ABC transporter substrate-binding protein [Candidatus Limnocylindrales bacterium]|jgi:peptide/nickel transport system substrate-binding protein
MRIQRGGGALRLAAGAAAIMIAAAACGSSSTPTGSPSTAPAPSTAASPSDATGASPSPAGAIDLFNTAYAPTEGTDGGTAIVGDWQEATQFNPYYLTQVTEANVASAVWSTLVVFTNDYKYAPDLAAQIPTLDNGGVKVPGDNGDAMTVTWTLRDGLKWSDGTDLTCDDFKYAWEWVLDKDNVGVITSGFDDVTAWDCPSATEMVLHFKNVFEGYITMVVAPLPRHYLSKIPIKDQVNGAGFRPDEVAKLPTSGAFKFESVTPAAELRLARNPYYKSWKTGLPAHLDNLVFKWYGDPDAMIAGFRGGETDVATDLQDSDIPKVQDLGDQVSAIPSLTYEYLRPNWSDVGAVDTKQGVGGCSKNAAVADRGNGCPMADPAMRQALAYAIDKNEINTRLLSGQAQVANTFVSPDAWFYVDQPPTTFDQEKAKQILEAAGWVDTDGDGIREKNGLKAKIELCTTTRQVRQDTLALIAAWLKDVGIDSVINPVDATSIFADYNESTADTPCVLSHGNFDVAEHATSSSIDPLGNYFSYHSSQFNPIGVNNASVNDPGIDDALDRVKNSVDFQTIKDAMADMQKLYVEDAVEVPLYYRKQVDLHAARLGNFFANPTQAGPTWNVADWFAGQ